MSEQDTVDHTVSATVATEIAEIAEDMLQLLERLAAVEQRQLHMSTRIEELIRLGQDANASQVRAIEALRRDLVGERSALAARATFTAIVPIIDSLHTMRSGLDPNKDERTYAQTAALYSTLTGLLQTLGFHQFSPTIGELFDPNRMECLGYTPGSPGQVLVNVYPGYLAGTVVVKPAGVMIAPASAINDGTSASLSPPEADLDNTESPITPIATVS